MVIAEKDGPEGMLPPLQLNKYSLSYYLCTNPNAPCGKSLSKALILGNIFKAY